MHYQEFLTQIVRMIKERLSDDAEVSINRVLKNNDRYYDGLLILYPGENITPTLYLNDYFTQYEDGRPMDEIADELLSIYEKFHCDDPLPPNIFDEFDDVKESICFRVVGRDSNTALLADVPYIPYMDLAIIFYISIDLSPMGMSSILIHNEHLKLWDISVERLYYTAYINTRNRNDCKIVPITSMISALSGLQGVECRNDPNMLYVLTTGNHLYGASFMLYKDVLADFSSRIGDDFYILPSSIHELIFLGMRNSPPVSYLQEMVQDINSTVVEKGEILSNSVYCYHAETHSVELVSA